MHNVMETVVSAASTAVTAVPAAVTAAAVAVSLVTADAGQQEEGAGAAVTAPGVMWSWSW